MSRRLVRIACVLVVAAVTTHGCVLGGKKRTGGGTNLGSDWGSSDDTGGRRPAVTQPR